MNKQEKAFEPNPAIIEHLSTIKEYKSEFIELLWQMEQDYLVRELREGTPTKKHLNYTLTNLLTLRNLVLNS